MVNQGDIKREQYVLNKTTGDPEPTGPYANELVKHKNFLKVILGVEVHSQGAADFAQGAIDAVANGNFTTADIHLKNLARVCNTPLGLDLVAAVEQYINASKPVKA